MRKNLLLFVLTVLLAFPALAGAECRLPDLPANGSDSLDALVNGWLYQYQTVQNGQPYFGDQNWYKSTVTTRYERFDNVLVKYDLYQDVLIIPVYKKTGAYPIVLNPRDIGSFTLDSHRFVNLNRVLEDCGKTYPGYYEMLYDGNLKLIVKWRKLMSDQDKMSGGKFLTEKTYYLIRDHNL